jgi:hypothetical protein
VRRVRAPRSRPPPPELPAPWRGGTPDRRAGLWPRVGRGRPRPPKARADLRLRGKRGGIPDHPDGTCPLLGPLRPCRIRPRRAGERPPRVRRPCRPVWTQPGLSALGGFPPRRGRVSPAGRAGRGVRGRRLQAGPRLPTRSGPRRGAGPRPLLPRGPGESPRPAAKQSPRSGPENACHPWDVSSGTAVPPTVLDGSATILS